MSEAYWLDSVLSGFRTTLVPPKTSEVWRHPLRNHLDSIISLEIGTRKHLQGGDVAVLRLSKAVYSRSAAFSKLINPAFRQ